MQNYTTQHEKKIYLFILYVLPFLPFDRFKCQHDTMARLAEYEQLSSTAYRVTITQLLSQLSINPKVGGLTPSSPDSWPPELPVGDQVAESH